MLCEFFVLFAIFLATAIIYLLSYARRHYGELEKLGIPVVKPHFFLGSSPNYYKIHNHLQDLEWFKTYGDVFGSYEGRVPTIFICDPDIARQIMIKDFDHFRNHDFHDLEGTNDKNKFSQMMDFLHGEKWKVVRSQMSPSFTSVKLKRMSLIMNDVSEEYVIQTRADLKKSSNGVLAKINLNEEIFTLLTDMVARVTLNIKIDNPKDPNNDFAKALRQLFASFNPPAFVAPFTRSFPFILPLLLTLRKCIPTSANSEELDFFSAVFRKVIADRKKSGQRQDDFVDFVSDFRDKTEKDPELKKLGITEATVIANAVEFFIAGQDSMSTAFSVVAYHLTRNPEIEKKLYAEIDAYTKKYNGKVDHDTFGELPYLNACLTEALRLQPVFSRTDRRCNKDWEYKGLQIKKGMTVVIPLWPYHRNPKYYPDPEKFDPERFMPENKDKLDPMAYCIFGHGPRMCIGMRFAFECLTMFSVHIFQNFQFTARSDTELTCIPGIAVLSMIGPMNLDIKQRIKSN